MFQKLILERGTIIRFSRVVPFNKNPLFSKDLIAFIISFISIFVRVVPEPLVDLNFLLS